MSASEWARITEERDGAVFHLKSIINQLDEDGEDLLFAIERAAVWLKEEFGEMDD